MTSDNRLAAPVLSRWTFLHRKVRRETFVGWLFILPALAMYALFVLTPLVLPVKYSFY